MTRYAMLEAQRARRAKRLRQEPDQDGFITVTRGGRTGPARQEEALAAAERQKQKTGGGFKDFYRFQLREERKKAQGELLRKFEEDRRKVEEMKSRRVKFRVGSIQQCPIMMALLILAAIAGIKPCNTRRVSRPRTSSELDSGGECEGGAISVAGRQPTHGMWGEDH